MELQQNPALFRDINADDAEHTTTIIESCCMSCFKNVM